MTLPPIPTKPSQREKIAALATELGLEYTDDDRIVDATGKVLIEANWPNAQLNTLNLWKRTGKVPGTPKPTAKQKPDKTKKPRQSGLAQDRPPKDAA